MRGRLHSRARDRAAISHHYDLSNDFYELILDEHMAYSSAYWTSDNPEYTLADAQADKLDRVCRKVGLDSVAGQRFLDIGCGWGSLSLYAAEHFDARVVGVTISREQKAFIDERIAQRGLADRVEIRVQDYREIPERNFDGICSLGMMEHVGVRHYDEYFAKMYSMLRPGGRLLNHQITRRDSRQGNRAGAFIDRYVFPDGELASPGVVHQHLEDSGLEVIHEENLRQHYAWTLQHWCENLQEHWDEAVEAVGPQTPLLWGLYMAGSRWNFERNNIQIHQFLAVRPTDDPEGHYYPQRPWWRA